MEKTFKERTLARKDLVEATGCPPYLIAYYTQCGYLPIIRPSSGAGRPIIYHPDAISVVRERMASRQPKAAEECEAGSLDGPNE